MLAELRRRAGVWKPVRLSASGVCPTPIALGWFEISVPERFITDLEPNQQRSALAHELAHLVRRDPVWELFAGILEALFFFQPLNRIARHRLRDAAENLSDDWAVRQTGSPLSLACCLTDIASWVGAGSEPLPTGTIAMAEGGPPLLRRVRRLAERDEPEPHPSRLRFAGAGGLLVFMATAAPAISLGGPPAVAGQYVDEILDREGPATLETSERSPENHPGTVPSASAILPDTVIVHPNPSAELAERWQWALERGLPDGVWIAWGVDGPTRGMVVGGSGAIVDEDRWISSNSRGAPDARGFRSLKELLPAAGERLPNVAFLFGFPGVAARSEDVAWIRLRSADAPLGLNGRSLIWLGRASTPESLDQLRRIYEAVETPELKQEIAAALTLHREEEEVLQAVRDVLKTENRPEIRAEAVQWLPRIHPGTERIVSALLTTAFDDPAEQVRLEAVDAIANLDSEEARRALVTIVETHPDMDARSEAAQALVRRGQ